MSSQGLTASRQTEISEVMSQLGNVLVECEQEIESLSKRLEGVRTAKPSPPSIEGNEKPSPKLCTLAQGVKEFSERIVRIVITIKTLQRELEV